MVTRRLSGYWLNAISGAWSGLRRPSYIIRMMRLNWPKRPLFALTRTSAKFESRSSFSTWLYRIAANLSIDFRRREGRHQVLRGEDAENEINRLPSPRGDSYQETVRTELSKRINEALKELTPEHRAVILLREVEGLSYDEISEVLQVPRGTVMSRLHYARGRMRATLKDLGRS